MFYQNDLYYKRQRRHYSTNTSRFSESKPDSNYVISMSIVKEDGRPCSMHYHNLLRFAASIVSVWKAANKLLSLHSLLYFWHCRLGGSSRLQCTGCVLLCLVANSDFTGKISAPLSYGLLTVLCWPFFSCQLNFFIILTKMLIVIDIFHG